MLTVLITVSKGTLFGLLQRAQKGWSLGTITETHESFFWRKYSTAEVLANLDIWWVDHQTG
jgi:hypothetical protein